MTTRERLAVLIEQLPEDQLQLALERLEPLAKTPTRPLEVKDSGPEATEFVVSNSPARQVRLPIWVRAREPLAKVVMEVGDISEKHAAAIEALAANARWWREHRVEIVAEHHNTYIAVSRREVFRGGAYFDALANARAKHPDDTPFIIRLFNSGPVTVNAN